MNAKIKMIVKEFYTAMTCAMDYEWNEQHKSLAHKVLNFLLEINGEAELLDEIWSVIHGAACVKTCADVSLMGSLENTVSEDVKMAIGIKSDILFSKQITRQKPFDIDLLKESLRTPVERGETRACKLWAVLCWLGLVDRCGKQTAISIWEMLAINGDETAMLALALGHRTLGKERDAELWNEVFHLRGDVGAMTSVMEALSLEPGEAESICELISCVQTRASERRQEVECIDVHLARYALYSKDDLRTKLERISSERNFYLVMLNERMREKRKPIGFVSGN